MPRAIWLSAEPPDRNLGGGNIRQAHLLTALAREFETDLVTTGQVGDEMVRAAVASVIEVPGEPPPIPRSRTLRRARDLWRATASRDPADNVSWRWAREALLPYVARTSSYDLVVVEHTPLAHLVPADHANAWTLTIHHLSSRTTLHQLDLALTARHRWLLEQELKKARRIEARVAHGYDRVYVTSEEDAAALTVPVTVVPNGVDADRFAPTPLPEAPRIVMSGTLDYLPNVDGVLWFCAAILPALQRRVPSVTMEIVGRHPLPEVAELAHLPGVNVRANVEAVLPHLESARVAVVPLRIGSGTRIKALEAMAAGRPVVGTSIGLEGLGIENGSHALIADEPSAFVDAVVRVLTDDTVAAALAQRGRALVEEGFSWRRIARIYVASLSELL